MDHGASTKLGTGADFLVKNYSDRLKDGYLHPTTPKYADQKRVFDDLGVGVLTNAWDGFNCSLFAYGQTGSGKSYSMVGYG